MPTIYISEEMRELLDELRQEENRPIHNQIECCIKEYAANREKKPSDD